MFGIGRVVDEQPGAQSARPETGDGGDPADEATTTRIVARLQIEKPCRDRAGRDARCQTLQGAARVELLDPARHHEDDGDGDDGTPTDVVGKPPGAKYPRERAEGVDRIDLGERARL